MKDYKNAHILASVAVKPPTFRMILIEIILTVILLFIKKRDLLEEPLLQAALEVTVQRKKRTHKILFIEYHFLSGCIYLFIYLFTYLLYLN